MKRVKLIDLPVIGDYRDSRAAATKGKVSSVEWIMTGIGVLASSAGGITSLWKALISDAPLATAVLRAALPCACLLLSIVAVSSRRRRSTPLSRQISHEYTYGRHQRIIAKIALPFLACLSFYRTHQIIPNKLSGTRSVSGYLCDVDGLPISTGRVKIVDEFGQTVSIRQERIDSLGFFIAAVVPWGLRPADITLLDAGCSAPGVPVTQHQPPGKGCWRSTATGADEAPVWEVRCDASHKD